MFAKLVHSLLTKVCLHSPRSGLHHQTWTTQKYSSANCSTCHVRLAIFCHEPAAHNHPTIFWMPWVFHCHGIFAESWQREAKASFTCVEPESHRICNPVVQLLIKPQEGQYRVDSVYWLHSEQQSLTQLCVKLRFFPQKLCGTLPQKMMIHCIFAI